MLDGTVWETDVAIWFDVGMSRILVLEGLVL
jgi:hypothetical protein